MTKVSEKDGIIQVVDDGFHFQEFKRDNLDDLNSLADLLMEELEKEQDKQKQWFNKYWEMKKKVNKITDFIEGIK